MELYKYNGGTLYIGDKKFVNGQVVILGEDLTDEEHNLYAHRWSKLTEEEKMQFLDSLQPSEDEDESDREDSEDSEQQEDEEEPDESEQESELEEQEEPAPIRRKKKKKKRMV